MSFGLVVNFVRLEIRPPVKQRSTATLEIGVDRVELKEYRSLASSPFAIQETYNKY